MLNYTFLQWPFQYVNTPYIDTYQMKNVEWIKLLAYSKQFPNSSDQCFCCARFTYVVSQYNTENIQPQMSLKKPPSTNGFICDAFQHNLLADH